MMSNSPFFAGSKMSNTVPETLIRLAHGTCIKLAYTYPVFNHPVFNESMVTKHLVVKDTNADSTLLRSFGTRAISFCLEGHNETEYTSNWVVTTDGYIRSRERYAILCKITGVEVL